MKRLGPDHPNVVMTMNHIACIYCLFDQADSALTIFKEIHDILCRTIGSLTMAAKLDLLHITMVSYNLGYMESRLNNYDEIAKVLLVSKCQFLRAYIRLRISHFRKSFTILPIYARF